MRHRTRTNARLLSSGTDQKCPATPAPFATDDALLQAAIAMFRRRIRSTDSMKRADVPDEDRRRFREEEAAWTRHWHDSFRNAGPQVLIAQRCRHSRLNRLEREILVALMLDHLAMLPEGFHDTRGLFQILTRPDSKPLEGFRALSDHGRLVKAGLVDFDDPESDLAERTPQVDPAFVDSVVTQEHEKEAGWPVKTEAELFDRLPPLVHALMEKSESMLAVMKGRGSHRLQREERKARHLMHKLKETLKHHADWKLNELRGNLESPEFRIFVVLLGKYLGFAPDDDDDQKVCTGGGLARAVSSGIEHVGDAMQYLQADWPLSKKGLIQPSDGIAEMLSSNPKELEDVEFELTPNAVQLLGIDKSRRWRNGGQFAARRPAIGMKQLVLPAAVRRALNMALVHARCGSRLIDDWGLGETIRYGRSIVLMFSGPPGVGKTATAEALAHELGKPILVADYSKIENCFVGQTEKNIVRVFREAKDQDAVLFWDEADAMFYDRDSAQRNWEVRDVNVLLQELERFPGICILATNRKVSLDKALQRRITVKVEFDRPGRDDRRRIWEKLLPRKLPLARDVDLGRLCEMDLTGGEIKNVVLNAARLALQRSETGPVTMGDFHEALEMERGGGWNDGARKRIGFGR